MCGICGFNWNDEKLIGRMAACMVHRGPDQEGTFCAEGISLGHRRLSIIDLSEHGRQPMANEDGSIRIVFNGEIYNFPELHEELEKKGHRFQSRCDTEVIVHAYEEYGADCLQKLRGMFAFAIWDERRKTLFAARDRIGIKPLYYSFQSGRLVFASEIKSILEAPSVRRVLNRQALHDYIGFEFVPAPDTMFQGIR
jgi:asparagine synthase (glutamine-hydrolysing)